jgi:hypothetical protein
MIVNYKQVVGSVIGDENCARCLKAEGNRHFLVIILIYEKFYRT